MPLTYDDIPGSWGVYSRDWPALEFGTKDEADRAFVACSLENVVPYGSYVKVGNSIRVENEVYKSKLAIHLIESPLKTADAVIAARRK